MEEDVKGFSDYLDIVWRRKWWVILPSVLLSIISVIAVNFLPSFYKSEGTILIESQDIPSNLIQSTVTSYADQRIEIIKQRLLATDRASEVISKYGLYASEKQRSPLELVDLYRENVNISLVQANVTDPRSGRATRANIAFKVSFMNQSPQTAQKVANDLVTQFLDENVKTRSIRAEETKEFLKLEADKLQKKVQQIETKIAEFKDKYSDSLPELLQYNLSMISSLQQERAENQNEVMVLKDQIATMSLGLTTTPVYLSVEQQKDSTTGSSDSLNELKKLRIEYNALLGKYQTSHPDVLRVQKQIEGLENSLGIERSKKEQVKSELKTAEAERDKLLSKYSNVHPDVKAINKRINNLNDELSQLPNEIDSNKASQSSSKVSNPAYIQLKLRVDSAEREVNRIQKRQDEIRQSLQSYEKRVSQTNQVSRAYSDLTRDLENNLSKYKDLRAKQLQAELAQNLESDNKAESFTLLEPPLVPHRAEKPNRPKLMLVGVVGSIGTGISIALFIEFLFGGVRGYKQITQVVGKAPLVVIPVISTADEIMRKKAIRNRWIITFLLLVIASVAVVHFYVMNLEIVWYKVLRKIGHL